MQRAPREGCDTSAAYWAQVGRDRAAASLGMTAAMALGLQLAFSFLDRFAYPDAFPLFLAMRMAVNLLLLAILLRGRFTHPRASMNALCLAIGLEILAMTYATHAPTSDYYAGLIILFVGMPVLLPLSAVEAAVICGILSAGYAVSPLLVDGPVPWKTFLIHMVFLLSGCVESVLSCGFLSRARLNDFAQRREIEEARDHLRELDHAKSRFTANVHHELRTPLTLMLAPVEAMLAGEFGEVPRALRGYLETMHANALRLLKLINNLLDLAKIESQQLEIRRRPLDLARLGGEIAAGARPLAERKRVDLVTDFAEGLPWVNADPDALEKVFVNLLGNALKFTDVGGRIEVRARPEAEGVRLEVADTGVGIPLDQIHRVFDRFAQVDGSATRKHEGTGIGLSLVKELVELHGGRIWAESAGTGQGTEMRVWLPIGEPDAAAAEEVLRGEGAQSLPTIEMTRNIERWEDGRAEERAAPGEGPTEDSRPEVLVAEDNPEMRQLLAHLLRSEFRVRTVRNGREALEAVRRSPPAVVLTDVMMPEMSGTELCRALKGEPGTRGVPVVLVTSKAEREMKIEGLELGADDYVTKPFHPRELLARVRALVRLRMLQGELAERNAALERALCELKDTEVQLVQAERLAAVGELAAGVAHEVNNPVNFALNALRGLQDSVADLCDFAGRLGELDWQDAVKLPESVAELERLREEIGLVETAKTLRELVGIVTEGLGRTHRLVSDLRDFGGPSRSEQAPVDLRESLDSALRLLRSAMSQAGVRVETLYDEALPSVVGDPTALNQLFLNLLKNAIEALEGSGGVVEVEARRRDGKVAVWIRDDGPGIPDDVRRRLFEPFFTTKAAGRGSGLGLSICRRIVAAHGGTIEIDSAPGRGTSQCVQLPLDGTAER